MNCKLCASKVFFFACSFIYILNLYKNVNDKYIHNFRWAQAFKKSKLKRTKLANIIFVGKKIK